MKQYEVTDLSITFGIGMVLGLTERQYRTRKHALTKKHADTFMVKSPVQFKHGEVIGVLVKGQLSRAMQTRLQPIETENEKQPKHQHKESKRDEAAKENHSKNQKQKTVESNKPQSSSASS